MAIYLALTRLLGIAEARLVISVVKSIGGGKKA
jgi:hypothetical protein